jgi:hypothetical protein
MNVSNTASSEGALENAKAPLLRLSLRKSHGRARVL